MAVAKTKFGPLTIVGAPRYQHRGVAMAVYQNSLDQTIDPVQWQVRALYQDALTDLNHTFSNLKLLLLFPSFVQCLFLLL